MVHSYFLMSDSSHNPNTSNGADEALEERLGLYQVFLKLYETRRSLLDEILDLEDSDHKVPSGVTFQYIQGVIQDTQIYLVTNLVQGKSQTVYQSQLTWTIGRDSKLALPVPDKRLSRLHAAIYYTSDLGFCLADLNSTNGSYVNGEQVRHSVPLADGDQIRLGSLSFTFFLCNSAYTAETAPPPVITQLRNNELAVPPPILMGTPPVKEAEIKRHNSLEDTSLFLRSAPPPDASLDADQQSEILDRFLNRQNPSNQN